MTSDSEFVLIVGVGTKQVGARLAQTPAAHGPNLLVLTGRFTNDVESVTELIRKTYPNVHIRIIKLDVASFESVWSPVVEVDSYTEQNIDILIGVDGFGVHLATSYLGSFLLTILITDK
ncbi:0a2eeaec-9eb5-43f5-a2cb-0178db64a6ab [Sclerotinia trifoliorum]|uniref:0a2eeaec-9eb5-43f5-a2cb-0178db64a6ab n=1 Tax=Sclerotinia trifoliorum TaxID=28548 RepID=A0A8H2ZT62_9HELO|nr:0a2eeaec-9eb5-43f5-a2cb-0178db64a6ab [Sclerotinia trifoliorum]